jgi:hypothetical protein
MRAYSGSCALGIHRGRLTGCAARLLDLLSTTCKAGFVTRQSGIALQLRREIPCHHPVPQHRGYLQVPSALALRNFALNIFAARFTGGFFFCIRRGAAAYIYLNSADLLRDAQTFRRCAFIYPTALRLSSVRLDSVQTRMRDLHRYSMPSLGLSLSALRKHPA